MLPRDYSKYFELLPFLHRRSSFKVIFYLSVVAEGKALKKLLSFAPKGPLETLIFTSIIVSLLPPANTSFNTYRMLVGFYNETQFPFGAYYAKLYSVSFRGILNIKMFHIALKCHSANKITITLI